MNAPEKIYRWLSRQFPCGCKFNGHEYVIDYLDPDAPLVRADVFEAEAKVKSEAKKVNKAQLAEVQLGLPL